MCCLRCVSFVFIAVVAVVSAAVLGEEIVCVVVVCAFAGVSVSGLRADFNHHVECDPCDLDDVIYDLEVIVVDVVLSGAFVGKFVGPDISVKVLLRAIVIVQPLLHFMFVVC